MTDDTSNHHECPECGQTYVGLKPLNGHDCPEQVAVNELEKLADRMESGHEIKHPDAFRCQEKWAKELREVIEDHD